MNKLLLTGFAVLMSSHVFAFEGIDDKHRKTKPGDIYFGLSGTVLDISGFKDDGRALSAMVGVNVINKDYGTIAVDTFFGRTIDAATDQENVDADVNIAGIFAAYRTPTKIFGKAKAGVVFTELSREGSDLDDDNSEFAWGVGLGAEIFYGVDLELEFTQISDEVDAIGINLILND